MQSGVSLLESSETFLFINGASSGAYLSSLIRYYGGRFLLVWIWNQKKKLRFLFLKKVVLSSTKKRYVRHIFGMQNSKMCCRM